MERLRKAFQFFRGNVLVLTVCRCMWTISMGMAMPYFSLYVIALGGSSVEIGLINALGGLAGLILYPVGGYIADHRGRIRLVGILSYFFSAIFTIFALATSWQMLAVGRFSQRLADFYSPALRAIMADSIPPSLRGIGFATTMAIPSTFRIFAPYIGGYLISIYGLVPALRIGYALSFGIGLLVATMRLKLLKETLIHTRPTVPLRNIPLLLKTSYQSMIDSFRWMSTTLRSIALIQVLLITFVSIAAPFWVVYATQIIGLTELDWGTMMLLLGLVRIILAIPIGRLVDLYGPRRIILLGLAIVPLPVFLFIFCSTYTHVLIALFAVAISNSLMFPAFSAFLANAIPRERRGRLFALMGQGVAISYGGVWASGFLLFIPMAIGSLIGGYIYELNPQYPWFILSGAVALCLVLAYRFVREPERREL